jgi:hypothetical protein
MFPCIAIARDCWLVQQCQYPLDIRLQYTRPRMYNCPMNESTSSSRAVSHARSSSLSSQLDTAYFKCASEPLFNSSHADATFGMTAVFPNCLTAAGFLNALMYSILQTMNGGEITSEGLRLQAKALQCLRQAVSSSILNYADVGAIMILQGVAVSIQDEAKLLAN